MTNELDDLPLLTQQSKEKLNERQLLDYKNRQEEFVKWCLHLGKNPERSEGYSPHTLEKRLYRIDQFYRWIWNQEDGYTTEFTTEHADNYMKELAYSDESNSHKANTQKALKMLFKWREHELNGETWQPERSFSYDSSNPRDYFTMEERRKLREAALEYGSIPAYNDLAPEERDRWKAYLAQKFEKPKSEVTPRDWKRANGWKIPSLVWTSLDAGLRPIEVERAVTSWLDLDNGVLRIPKEESSKNEDNWIVGLQDRTAEILSEWKSERQYYDRYKDTDKLWLTRRDNPYQSQSLRHILKRLCEIAGIDMRNRKISWYAIRHSVGTYMTHVEDLGSAKAQLRHKSEKTTLQYDQAPVEERKDALDKMG